MREGDGREIECRGMGRVESRGGFEAFDRDFGLFGRFVLELVRDRTKRRNERKTCDPEEEPGVRGVIGGEDEEEDEK